MNFSPYSPSPDDDRSSRKPKKTQQKQTAPAASYSSYQAGNVDSYAEQGLLGESSSSSASSSNNTVRVNKYETTLPIRVDIEASLAYILGPVTGNKLHNLVFLHNLTTSCRFIIVNSRKTK